MSYSTRAALVTVGVALLLAGCSGGNEAAKDAPEVATLQSAAPTGGAPADDKRPVYPVDASDEQVKSIIKPWIDCLREKGAKKPDTAVQLLIQKGGTAEDLGRIGGEGDVAAWKACESLQPESSEQHQLRTDPTEFKDNQREWYRCAQAAGYKLTAPDPETGEFGITEVGPNGDFNSQKMQDCRREAFAH